MAGKRSVSGFRGVCWYAPTGRWMAQARIEGKRRTVGYRATAQEAAELVDRCESDPDFARALLATDGRHENFKNIQRRSATGYRGVKQERSGNFVGRLHAADGDMYLGSYRTSEEAAVAYDRKAREIWGSDAPLNFPFPGERSARRGVAPQEWASLPIPSPILAGDRPPEMRAKISAGIVRHNQTKDKPQRAPTKDPAYFRYKSSLPALSNDGRATYIYALHDPTEVSQRVYVGMAVDMQERYDQHLASIDVGRRTIAKMWMKSLLRRGVRPAMELVEVVPPGGDYQEAECFWIASLRAMGVEMANMTDGGHGARGYFPPPEVRAKLSAARTGKKMPREGVERGAAKRRGRKMDPAIVERVAQRNRGRKWTDDERARLTAIRRGLPARGDGPKGVRAKAGKYDARIGGTYLGRFDTAEAAARAYDDAARAAWGKDAALNFPGPGEKSARKPK